MELRDRDLISIQQAREMAAQAAAAQKRFATFSQKQVDAVVEACASAALEAAETLARAAVEETGYGNVPDKIMKNRFGAVDVLHAIRGMRTIGLLREDKDAATLEYASPVGVVAAIIPSTNPTSTAIYKTLISLKAGNAIVLSPHPSAIKCICQAASVMERAALSAGAPDGLIRCMSQTTLQGTQELMRRPEVGVILATGGTGLVRAAYSSGKPAYGVGPGNVPAAIERSADVRKAIADILAGKTFDYGTICSSEQSIVVEETVRERALDELRQQGAYFLSPEEAEEIARLVFQPGSHTPNPKIVGRPATMLAEMAGITVPATTRVLLARLEPDQVGRDFPLSAEKLSPILAFYSVPDFPAVIELAVRLLRFGGAGHTASIHSQDAEKIRQYGQAVPAFRVAVNTSAVHGSTGYSTNLFPAMTLGCGAPGGNITSDNIGPQHLFNIKRVAWESRAVEHRSIPAERRMMADVRVEESPAERAAEAQPIPPRASVSVAAAAKAAAAKAMAIPVATPAAAPAGTSLDRAEIARVVERVLSAQGIGRGSEASKSPAPAAASAAPVAPPQSASSPRTEAPKPAAAFPAKSPAEPAAKPKVKIEIVPFVSESDVRLAMTRSQKIFIGPKTIVTPSARDLGREHEVFVETGMATGSPTSRGGASA